MKTQPQMYIVVVYGEEQCEFWPMGLDTNCEGALCCDIVNPVVFSNKADARRAINISKAYAKLQDMQGHVANTDFLPPNASYLKIVSIRHIAAQSTE